jgi:GNAT superfamily N-acetyltransferase
MRRDVLPHVVRHVDLLGTDSVVLYSELTPETVEEAIRAQVAYFDGLGHSFEWKLYDYDPPADLAERLVAHGFVAEEEETTVVLDATDLPDVLIHPVSADIRPITAPEGLDDVIAVEEAVWADDRSWLRRQLTDELQLAPDLLRIYVAYVDDTPASAAWVRFHPGARFAGLWGGSTLPAYRKRGLYTALLAVRTQEALRHGARFLTVDASPMSRPILEKLGFRAIGTTTPYIWSRREET